MGPRYETNNRRTWSVRVSVPIPVRHYVELYNKADDETRAFSRSPASLSFFVLDFGFAE